MNTEFHSEMNYPSLFSPLIAEASPVVATGFGSPGVPGIYTGQQVLQRGFPLTPYDRKTFYGGDVAGYTDYPKHDELAQA